MSDESNRVEAKAKQREVARRATREDLRGRKPAELELQGVEIPGIDGYVSFLMRGLHGRAYDKLVTLHPPTVEQRAQGHSVNVETFGPALLAKVCIEPEMSAQDWIEIWSDESWGRGELMSLFGAADQLCNKGLDLAPFAQD